MTDTTLSLSKKLRKEIKKGNFEIINLAIDALISGTKAGYCEYTVPLGIRYPELFCRWCGGLHRDKEHDKKLRLSSKRK